MPTIKITTSENGKIIKEVEYKVTDEQVAKVQNFFKEMREKKEQRRKEIAKRNLPFNN